MSKLNLKPLKLKMVVRDKDDGTSYTVCVTDKPKRPDVIKRNESDVNKHHVIAQLLVYALEHPNAQNKNKDADVCNIINAGRDPKKKKVTPEIIKDIRLEYERAIKHSEQVNNGEIPDAYELAEELFNTPPAKKIATKAK